MSFVVLILLCYWLSLLNTVSRQIRMQYKAEIQHTVIIMPYNIDFSSYNSRYNKCLSQSRTNRRSITMQGFTIADAEIHMPFHNSWTWICDRLPYIPVIFYLIHPYPNLSYLDLDLFEKDWLGIFKAWYPAIEDIATRPQIHSIGLG